MILTKLMDKNKLPKSQILALIINLIWLNTTFYKDKWGANLRSSILDRRRSKRPIQRGLCYSVYLFIESLTPYPNRISTVDDQSSWSTSHHPIQTRAEVNDQEVYHELIFRWTLIIGDKIHGKNKEHI